MLEEKIIKDLEKSIIKFFDKNGEPITFSSIKIVQEMTNTYHSQSYVLRVYVDGQKISVRDKKVLYRCSCGTEHVIFLKKFLSKTRLRCNACSEDDEKKANHSRFFNEGYKKGRQVKKNVYIFENESEEFKKLYYQRHLSQKEFIEQFLPHIYSIGGKKIGDDTCIEYIEHM